MSETTATYDAVIVGGGHNGLACACYLAMAGKKVVVTEALEKVGGMCSSGYLIPEAPQHLVHPCALDLMSLRVHPMMPEELDLARHGFKHVEMTPGYVYLHPDGQSLAFWRDVDKTAAEIRRFSEADAAEFIEFMKIVNAFIDMAIPMMRVDPALKNWGAKFQALKALLRNKHLKPEIMGMLGSPAYQVIMERFEHPITQSALCCLLGAAGPITNEGTGVYFALLGFLLRTGVGRVVGGMQQLSNALAARLEELGGTILLNAPAAEIIAQGGKATGVRLKDGRVLNAKAVVASIHPKNAFDIVTPGALDRRAMVRVALAPANAHGGAPLKVDVALRGQVSIKRHQAMRSDGLDLRKCVLLIGTTDAVLENFRAAARGEVPTLPYMWSTLPSAVDPSQAPAGQDIAYLYPVAMPVKPGEGWDAIRGRVGQQVIDQASEYMDGLKDLEIGRRVEASPDLAKRLNVHNGCVVHIDTGTTRSGGMRPAFGLGGETLPVAGLFFGGAGIHPGGGINGLPGRIAAGRVKRFLAK
ncbi:phytoene desaturase family protein [Pelomonas aquatica]|jgi:phytoene dehydrogenase-like protein|uniref:Pyridine nucleotide-disulfide oxidoreductase domain-containing protein 2 n=1 Tax=Pelomonas aquatica TaxID=431058 RepID=A0A9X4LIR6_9BURK|nr:NAD(P)/FAD-dependent oxidoreductase [Pelomonas aquatica]MCY4756588.1 NAD(P)/FAD-dependent oxidoreductase [Pelomonas aquatica]MDG0863943.1 NAD(P)/FAD-dependent oxidoreductase [Pelomonas aquatica]